jgi:RNA polymerase sigma-70 factor (ECF subfamily)
LPRKETPERGGESFAATDWSLVVAAGETGNPERPDALADLCRAYWRPVYTYLRRRGYDTDRAQDLTQGFFAAVLARNFFKAARPELGRFRCFLLSALKYYLTHERDRAAAAKRGGGRPDLPLDLSDAESRYCRELTDEETPEVIFERRWARAVMDRAVDRLHAELKWSPDSGRSLRLLSFVSGDATGQRYRQMAGELAMSEGAVKVAVHRLRRRLGKLLREEVARTVLDPGTIEVEVRYLFSVIDSRAG